MQKKGNNVEIFSAEELVSKIRDKSIKVPYFQRGTVWTDQQKENFRDSIKKKFPFGSITLYKYREDENSEKFSYQLLDGLQRSNTIKEFITEIGKKFFSFKDHVPQEDISALVLETNSILKNKISEEVLKQTIGKQIEIWLGSLTDISSLSQISEQTPINSLIHKLDLGDLPTSITKKWEAKVGLTFRSIFQRFKSEVEEFKELKVPANIYEGDLSYLPTLFARINNSGTPLDPYQIWAASWSSKKVKITDRSLDKIVDYAAKRYDNLLLDTDFTVEGQNLSEVRKTKEISFFDIAFGFGRLLSSRFPSLFRQIPEDGDNAEKNATKISESGFKILNACLNKHAKENMEILPINMMGDPSSGKGPTYSSIKTNEDLNKLIVRIIEVTEEVDRHLSKITSVKGNKKKKNSEDINHPDSQMVAMISSLFILKHGVKGSNNEVCDVSLDSENADWKKISEKLSSSLWKRYVLDIISPDPNMWHDVDSTTKDIGSSVFKGNFHYLDKIDWESFSQKLDSWFSRVSKKNLERTSEDVTLPSKEDKVFLKMVYFNKFNDEDRNTPMEIEHLATKGGMERKLEKFEKLYLPISSVGNLCFLPGKINNKKKAKTLYQVSERDLIEYQGKDVIKPYTLSQIEEKFSITSREDLEFINNDFGDDDEKGENQRRLQSAFDNFINNRYRKMKEMIRASLFPDSDELSEYRELEDEEDYDQSEVDGRLVVQTQSIGNTIKRNPIDPDYEVKYLDVVNSDSSEVKLLEGEIFYPIKTSLTKGGVPLFRSNMDRAIRILKDGRAKLIGSEIDETRKRFTTEENRVFYKIHPDLLKKIQEIDKGEKFFDIPGFRNRVSNYGRVTFYRDNGDEALLKIKNLIGGYNFVEITMDDGEKKGISLGKLLAFMFLRDTLPDSERPFFNLLDRTGKYVVIHKDGNNLNDNIDNLSIGTRSESYNNHRLRGNSYLSGINQKPVIAENVFTNEILKFESKKSCMIHFSMDPKSMADQFEMQSYNGTEKLLNGEWKISYNADGVDEDDEELYI
jgi:hypothetical protein